jgi:hypothetical protein
MACQWMLSPLLTMAFLKFSNYRSLAALARHRATKHAERSFHQFHSASEECTLCPTGEQWPPEKGKVFPCPECNYAAASIQALRYHYLRTHGDQVCQG